MLNPNTLERMFINDGFTILEVVTVMVIVGILVAVAIPHYESFQSRVKRTEALAILHSFELAEILYFSIEDQYTTNLSKLGNYGFMTKPQRKYYNPPRDAFTDDIASFGMSLEGNLDRDPTHDIIVFKRGNSPTYTQEIQDLPHGISIFLDDVRG